MSDYEDRLIAAAQEIIFAARLGGSDIAKFGQEAAELLMQHELIEKANYEFITGKV